jgi:hypothetical protein
MTMPNADTTGEVFISYSHKDADWLGKLQTMMSPLIRNHTVSVWWDAKIRPSQKWRVEIDKALASAKVGVLLVSPDFLASDFINQEELPYLLKAAEQRRVKLTWVLLRGCLYERTPIAQYQAAHDVASPLNSLTQARLDAALVQICRAIEGLLENAPPDALGPTKILVVYGPWDERWKKVLSKHLDIPNQLGILSWHRVPSARESASWISRFKPLGESCSAIVFLVSPELAASDSIWDAELGAILEAGVRAGRLRILPLMTGPCHGVGLPAWLPAVGRDVTPEQTCEQFRQYREQLNQDAACANIATQLGNLLKNDSVHDSMPSADLLQLYRWRIRENVLRLSTQVNIPFYWDLFALPIRCKSPAGKRRGTVSLRCEQLLQQGGKHLLLLGAPASGKTTACKRIEAYPPNGIIPLRLGNQVPENVTSLVEQLSDEEHTGIKDIAFLREQIGQGKLLLVADGISENRDVAGVVARLDALVAQLPRVRCLVTCRTNACDSAWFPRFRRWIIKDLTRRSQVQFLAKQEERVRDGVCQAFQEKKLQVICSNQFLFLMVVRRIAKKGTKGLETTAVGIYKDFLEDFLSRWEKIEEWELPTIENFLQELAVNMRSTTAQDGLKRMMATRR